jgi:3-oxoacyl-[acyl-carrier protein] reductase
LSFTDLHIWSGLLHRILDYIIQYCAQPGLQGEMMSHSSGMLSGKVALVTGGSRGIGAGIVKRLAKDGAAVAFTYAASHEKAEHLAHSVEAAGGRALAICADSADAAAVQGAIDQTVKTLGRLDVFVNNAGILLGGTIDQVSLEELDKMLAVNVRSVYVGIQAAARHMAEGGRIVTIGSVVAQRTAVPGASTYSMTKSAVAGMVRGVAVDLAPRGITVNNVQPGPTATDMNPADGPRSEFIRNLLPVKRFGTSDEIAGLVAYLSSPEAGFVTGASLTIDGGYLA